MKKNIIIGLFCLFIAPSISAQDSLFNKIGNLLTTEKVNGDYVFRAVESGIYLIRSAFVIKSIKTGQEYGKAKYKNNYFSYQYNVAMVGKKHLWIPPSVLEPWRLDSLYKEYGDSVRPVLKPSYMHTQLLNDTIVKVFDTQKITETWKFKRTDAPDSTKNLSMPSELPTKSCWLISFYVDEEDKFKNTVTSITPVWDKNNLATVPKPILTPKGKLVGGVLLKESMTFGKIEFQLVGLYFFDGNRWIIQAPMLENQLKEAIGLSGDTDKKDKKKKDEKEKKKEKKNGTQ
jgi:hypothetical protein